MKKIALFARSLGSGGAERQLVKLTELLKECQYDVKVFYFDDKIKFYEDELDNLKIEYDVVKGRPLMPGWMKALYKALKKYNPDVVIAYLNIPSLATDILKLLGCKWKLIVSDRGIARDSLWKKLIFNMDRFADYVVANSHNQGTYLRTHYHCLRNKALTITNYIENDKFKPVDDRKFPESKEFVKIICVGRKVPQKNLMRFVGCIDMVVKNGYSIEVDWYGGGDQGNNKYYQEVVDKVESLGLSRVIQFHPPYKNIEKKYVEADLFCLPSISEGFANVLTEAMACGLPVVASNVSDNPLIVGDESCGFIFDPYNVEEMANSIIRFLNLSSEQKERMAKNSRKRMLEVFPKEAFVQQYIELIENNGA